MTRRRRASAFVVVGLLAVAAVASGQSAEPTHRVTDAVGNTLDVVMPITVDTIPPATTTTSSTTTTTEPATTTTTIPTPSTTIQPPSGDDFDLLFKAEGGEGGSMWNLGRFPYDRDLIPGHAWTDGNRQGYRCAYIHAFHPLTTGAAYLVATAARPAEATYGMVNDSGMFDGTARWWDGTPVPEGTPRETGECPGTTETYEPYGGPHEQVRVEIWHHHGNGALPYPVEVRDYFADWQAESPQSFDAYTAGRAKLEVRPLITVPFEVTSGTGRTHTVYERLTLILHFEVDAGSGEFLPVIVYYLDVIDPEYRLILFES